MYAMGVYTVYGRPLSSGQVLSVVCGRTPTSARLRGDWLPNWLPLARTESATIAKVALHYLAATAVAALTGYLIGAAGIYLGTAAAFVFWCLAHEHRD
jgi:hypothetical protein